MSDTESMNGKQEICANDEYDEYGNCNVDIGDEGTGFYIASDDEMPDFSNKFEGTPLDPYVKNAIVGNLKLPWSTAECVFEFLKESTKGQVCVTLEKGVGIDDALHPDTEHLHFFVYESKIQPETLKSYIRKKYPKLIGKGKGAKRYEAKFAKYLIQLIYIFKEKQDYLSNIEFLLSNKQQNMEYYANQYVTMRQSFGKHPAARFYEWLIKNKTTWVASKEWDFHKEFSSEKFRLRTELVPFITEYAKETDNANPGFAYCQKLINYVHLCLDEPNYIDYMKQKIEKESY